MSEQNSLVESNIKLVYYTISKYYPTFIHDEDVIQSGMEGLCRAAKYYNTERGKFTTLAVFCIRNEIRAELKSRIKHNEVYSLDTAYQNDDGTSGTLLDTVEDANDFAVDDLELFDMLNDYERQVIEKKISTGKVDHKDRKHVRNIKRKWRNDE